MHKPTFSQQNPIYPLESLQNANPVRINKNCAALSDNYITGKKKFTFVTNYVV